MGVVLTFPGEGSRFEGHRGGASKDGSGRLGFTLRCENRKEVWLHMMFTVSTVTCKDPSPAAQGWVQNFEFKSLMLLCVHPKGPRHQPASGEPARGLNILAVVS